MADQKGIDLLMKFKTLDGTYVEAESTDSIGEGKDGASVGFGGLSFGWDPKIAEKDPMLKGFKAGCVFEVFNFSFGTGVQWDGSDKDAQGGAQGGAPAASGAKRDAALEELKRAGYTRVAELLGDKSAAGKRGSSKSRNWTFGQKGDVEMQPVTFSRMIDKASSNLLWRCFNSKYFEKITLVKRRATGSQFAGFGYLRMDFGGAMITQINWSEDDEVEEQVTFVCRSVQIQYKPMLPSGKLGGTIEGSWKMPAVDWPSRDT